MTEDPHLGDLIRACELLQAANGWIRRIEERTEDLPALFIDNIDIKPLRKSIDTFLADNKRTFWTS